MSVLKTKGLILAESTSGDSDKMITVLTPNGKIGCMAKGAKNMKSTLLSGTQFLSFSDFIIYKSTSSYRINSAESIEIFYNIRLDIDKLTTSTKIAKILNYVTDESQNTYRLLQLALNTLYLISETDCDLNFVLSIFKIRLLSIIGYRPIIDKCTNQDDNEIGYFSIDDNGFKCEYCAKTDKTAIQISKSTQKAIRYIILSDAKKIYSFNLSDENKKELEMVSKLYLNKCLEQEF